MSILVPALAFAAFCIWLMVRIINRQERWAKWTAVLLVVLAGYPLSFVPAIWIHPYLPDPAQDAVRWIYEPRHWLVVTLFGVGNG